MLRVVIAIAGAVGLGEATALAQSSGSKGDVQTRGVESDDTRSGPAGPGGSVAPGAVAPEAQRGPSSGTGPGSNVDVRGQALGDEGALPTPNRGVTSETRDVAVPPLRGTDERVGGDSRGSSELNRASPEGKVDLRTSSGQVHGPGRK